MERHQLALEVELQVGMYRTCAGYVTSYILSGKVQWRKAPEDGEAELYVLGRICCCSARLACTVSSLPPIHRERAAQSKASTGLIELINLQAKATAGGGTAGVCAAKKEKKDSHACHDDVRSTACLDVDDLHVVHVRGEGLDLELAAQIAHASIVAVLATSARLLEDVGVGCSVRNREPAFLAASGLGGMALDHHVLVHLALQSRMARIK